MLNHPVIALILRVCAVTLSFGFSVIAAHVLGLKNFGIFNVLLSFVNVGVVFALLGHETFATRKIAASLTSLDTDVRKAILQYLHCASRYVWLAGILVCLFEAIIIWCLPIGRKAPFEMLLLIVLILFIARTRLSQGIIRGEHRAALAIVPDGILRPGIAIAGLSIMLLAGMDAVSIVVGILLGSSIIGLLFGKHWESKTLVVDNKRGVNIAARKKGSQGVSAFFSPAIYSSSILAVLSSQMAIIATGNLANLEQAGLYAAAERFALAAAIIGQTVYQAMASRFAVLYAEGDHQSLRVSSQAYYT